MIDEPHATDTDEASLGRFTLPPPSRFAPPPRDAREERSFSWGSTVLVMLAICAVLALVRSVALGQPLAHAEPSSSSRDR